VSLRSNSEVVLEPHASQRGGNFVVTDAESPVTMESQSRSEARVSLQVDFKVFSGAHVSLQVDFRVFSGAHVSLQVDFRVFSGAHVSLRSSSKFDLGSAEPQTDFDRRGVYRVSGLGVAFGFGATRSRLLSVFGGRLGSWRSPQPDAPEMR
jgi:hypothetical protein